MAIKYGNVHFLVFYCCVTVALGYEDIQAVFNKVSSLQADLLEKIIPAYIHSQVEEALSQILGDQSIYDRVKSLQHNQQRMKRNIQKTGQRVKVLEDQRERQMNAIRKFEEHYQTRKSQLEELQEQLNVTQHQGKNIDNSLSAFRDMVSVINTSVVDMNKTLGPEVNDIRKQLNVTTNQVSSLQYMVSVINTSVVDMNKTLGPEVNDIRKQLNVTIHQVSNTEDKLSSLRNMVSVMNESVIDMRTTFDQETDSIRQNLTNVTKAHLQDTDSLRNEVNHFDNVTKELKRSINSTNHHLIEVEGQKSSLFNNLTSFRSRVEKKFTEMPMSCACVEEDMNRLLVVRLDSDTDQYPDQIDLNSYTLSNYSYLRTSNIIGVTYDPTLRRIIFSRDDPRGIYSSRMDVTGVETLKTNVTSREMTVDDGRRLIFMTTYNPNSISRMTTRGEDFHVILRIYASHLSIDSRREVIYFTEWKHLYSVDYDGGNDRRLETIKRVGLVVVFDPASYSLLYGDINKVVQKSLSTGNNTEIATVHGWISSMVLHKNTLYISGYDINIVHLGNKSQSKVGKTSYYNNDLVLIP